VSLELDGTPGGPNPASHSTPGTGKGALDDSGDSGEEEKCWKEFFCCDLHPQSRCSGTVEERERAARRFERKLVFGVEITFLVFLWRDVHVDGKNLDLAILSSVFWLLGLYFWVTSMRPKWGSIVCWGLFGQRCSCCVDCCDLGHVCVFFPPPAEFDDVDKKERVVTDGRVGAVFLDLVFEEIPQMVISAVYLSRENTGGLGLAVAVVNIVANFLMAWYHMALTFALGGDIEGCCEHVFAGCCCCGAFHFGRYLHKRELRKRRPVASRKSDRVRL